MTDLEKCPSCGEDMEPGYIVSKNLISWCNHVPKVFCVCGEPLSKYSVLCAAVVGHRCKKCKIIRYQEIERPPKKETSDWPVG